MIVADANLVAYYLIHGDLTELAERVRSADSHWVSPKFIRYELQNIFAKHMRHGNLYRDACVRLYREAMELLRDSGHDVDSLDVFNLCSKFHVTAYDAIYVALARKLNIELVTADAELVEKFPDHVRSMKSF